MLEINVIPLSQPIGVFYLCAINAKDLLELTYPDPLSITSGNMENRGIYKLTGNQREGITQKRQEIGKYIDTVEATFPNTIILGANLDRSGSILDDEDTIRWKVIHNEECNTFKLIIPTNQPNARIIDGQHRLRGFEYSKKDQEFMLPCAVFLDINLPLQASIFATININQRKVDRSLAFELFGYNLEDEPFSAWSPDKLSIYLTRRLNIDPISPLRGHIKVIARQGKDYYSQVDWVVSTSVVVDGILSLISSSPALDRDDLMSVELAFRNRKRILFNRRDKSPFRSLYLEEKDEIIYSIIKNFFNSALIIIDNKQLRGYLTKTVGIQGLFDFLKKVIPRHFELKDFTKDSFDTYFEIVRNVDFNDPYFQASGIGRQRIRKVLLYANKLLRDDEIKDEDKDELDKLLR